MGERQTLGTLDILLHGKKCAVACCIQRLHRTSPHRPLWCLPRCPAFSITPCFPVKAPPVPYFPYSLGTDFFIDIIFFCPLTFLGLSVPANPITPRFLFLRFSSFVFLSIIFPWLIFSMLFSSFLVFLASLLIVFSCAFLSYPHIRTIRCPSHLLSFLP